jgi:uncharacterized protein
MLINVAQLLKKPIGTTRSYTVDESLQLIDDDPVEYCIEGAVELTRTDRGILVRGDIDTEVTLTCSRCLALFSLPLRLHIEDECFPVIDLSSGTSMSLPDQECCFIIDEHNMLVLHRVIREKALLSVPMKPLCSPECAGICPSCGVNLNQMHCNCPPDDNKSPFAELEKLALNRKLR